MPDYHTTIRLMNTDFPVTVTWDVCGIDDGQPEYELEAVVSDLLGDVTHLVLGSLQGHMFVHHEQDTGWQDPVRTAIFGGDVVYSVGDPRLESHAQAWQVRGNWGREQMIQREPLRTVFRTFSALQQKIFDEIDELPEQPDRVQAHYDWLAESW